MLSRKTIERLWEEAMIPGVQGFHCPPYVQESEAIDAFARMVEARVLENAADSNYRVTNIADGYSWRRCSDLRAAARRARKAAEETA